MLTQLSPEFSNNKESQVAEEIIRKCVHCGFCTATCPTYQVLGDERDSPRGRIYIIKSLLEGNEVTEQSRTHLDRCLTCRACETVCPSGVEYGRLLDIGRKTMVEELPSRPLMQRMVRYSLTRILSYRHRFSFCLSIARTIKPLLPKKLAQKIPHKTQHKKLPATALKRKIILFQGCVQDTLAPATNEATRRILARIGVDAISVKLEGCCGALSQHLDDHHHARKWMKNNIDVWMPYVEQGVEAIITTASGCGVNIKDYGTFFEDDTEYSGKAKRISELCMDVSEFLLQQPDCDITVESDKKLAFHCPCSLQHGQKLSGVTERLLGQIGFELVSINESHLCCGSAGTYSILQPKLSDELRNRKINNLMQHRPDIIVTANIGCQLHLQEVADVPVKHWIELLEEEISS